MLFESIIAQTTSTVIQEPGSMLNHNRRTFWIGVQTFSFFRPDFHVLSLSFLQERNNRDENSNHSPSFVSTLTKSTKPWFSIKRRAGNARISNNPTLFPKRKPCKIDRHCRKLFPLAYVLYLLIYFAVYYFMQV